MLAKPTRSMNRAIAIMYRFFFMMYVRTGIVPSFNIGFLAKKRGIVVEGCGKILQFGALIHSVSTDCGTGIFPALSD